MSSSKKINRFLDTISYEYPDEILKYPTDLKEAIIGTVEFFSGSEGIVTRILTDK